MISTEETLNLLYEDGVYNYRDLAEKIANSPITSESGFDQTINTVELFSFGNYAHYLKYRHRFVDLPVQGVRKLVKLTLVSICNENEGNRVPFEQLLQALEHALEQLGGAENHVDFLETILIEMLDEHLIRSKVDEELETVQFCESFVTRDAYNSKTYSLRVLEEREDIAQRSVAIARAQLQQWVETKIIPAQSELQSKPQ